MAPNEILSFFYSAKQKEFRQNEYKFLSVPRSTGKFFLDKWQP
jgi:hypothetical protein